MKARCISITDSKGNKVARSEWLTIGKTYTVLSVSFESDGRWLLRLRGDNTNGVALFPLNDFEITNGYMPVNWLAHWDQAGAFELAPLAWTRENFWQDYYDGKEDALKAFAKEVAEVEK